MKWAWYALAAAVVAACSAPQGTAMLPQAGDGAMAAAAGVRAAGAHAACSFAPPLTAPVRGTPKVAIAFGQLMETSKGARYAYSGTTLAYDKGKYVLAALSGTAYAKRDGLLIRSAAGAQVYYTGLKRIVLRLRAGRAHVKAGERIALPRARVTIDYSPNGHVFNPVRRMNPCGNQSGASGSIGILASSVAVQARFHTLSIAGTAVGPGPYPTDSPGPDVLTPSAIGVTDVPGLRKIGATVYERSDTFSTYYVVLCGNVAFATGAHLRYFGPIPYPTDAPERPVAAPARKLPLLVFFRDPGAFASQLTQPLPSPYPHACPAPPPAQTYRFPQLTFYQPGQTEYATYTSNDGASGDTVSFATTLAAVAVASPASVPVYATAPSPWPVPSNRVDFIAAGTGGAVIKVYDTLGECYDTSLGITVVATPSSAPAPTPMSNVSAAPTASPSPTATPSVTPTPSATPACT